MATLLHTADWQIGKQFGAFEPDEAALLAEARFTVVERLARLATDERVDAVLVAGDVFDAQGVSDKTLHRLFASLAGYAGPWVMIAGNHDAALAESVWTRALRQRAVPPHVHLCLQPQPLLLEAAGLAVLPAPLTQRHTHSDLTEWFAAATLPPGLLRVGLAHGSVAGILAEDIDATNPIAAGRAAQAGLDYLALGDWHGTRQVDERCWYSGTPETDRFRANDSGQALRVEMPGPGALPRVTPLRTGHYRWQQHHAELQVPSDLDALLQHLAGLAGADVVQLGVRGRTDLPGQRRLQQALLQARGRARCLLADLQGLRFEPSADDIAALHADGYLGQVLAELRAAQEADTDPGQRQLAGDALALLAGLLDERGTPEGGA